MNHTIKRGKIKQIDIEFDYLWNKIQVDNNLVSGRNYRNHTATWYGPVDYGYTGVRHKAQDMPNEFIHLARRLEHKFKYPKGYFNSALLNAYDFKGIAQHSDDEPIFVKPDGTTGAVATVSFGKLTNIFIVRKNTGKSFSFKQEDKDIYIMPEGNFQHVYTHGTSIPMGKRISITFRQTN